MAVSVITDGSTGQESFEAMRSVVSQPVPYQQVGTEAYLDLSRGVTSAALVTCDHNLVLQVVYTSPGPVELPDDVGDRLAAPVRAYSTSTGGTGRSLE